MIVNNIFKCLSDTKPKVSRNASLAKVCVESFLHVVADN